MTRTVADSALMMSVLSRPDWRDHMSLPPADIAWRDLSIDLKGLRIGLLLDAGAGVPAEPQVAAAVCAAAALFEAHGAIVEPVRPYFTPDMLNGLDRFWRNARVHTLHDPVDVKLRDIGRHALSGQVPEPGSYS